MLECFFIVYLILANKGEIGCFGPMLDCYKVEKSTLTMVSKNLHVGIKLMVPIWWVCQGERIFVYQIFYLGRYHSKPYWY